MHHADCGYIFANAICRTACSTTTTPSSMRAAWLGTNSRPNGSLVCATIFTSRRSIYKLGSMRRYETIVRTLGSCSRVAGLIRRMIKPGSNKGMALLCAGSSAIGDLRALMRPLLLAQLYRAVRLFVNFSQPSFKLAQKSRQRAKVRKSHYPPATPYQRLLADGRTTAGIQRQVQTQYETLDPVRLLSDIRATRGGWWRSQMHRRSRLRLRSRRSNNSCRVCGRRVWPTARRKPPAKKKKRKTADPFALVSIQLRSWFEAEPWRSSGDLFGRLQTEHVGVYAD
jgi:hypothetical protein